KGIEVIPRAGELLFGIMYFLSAVGLILIISSGTINLRFLQPVLAGGAGTVIYSVFKQTMFIPFGELIVLVMIFPYLKDRKKVKKTGFLAIIISGLILAWSVAINICRVYVNLML
ncbi:GerAB/ArcD/ProY family transporter, partial [Bacillus cereus]|uniref:GerAB/ArcD/ProY family transporter n=1 Tax=Bacillus cereus TaxID=1396 RepID=UPI0020C09B37